MGNKFGVNLRMFFARSKDVLFCSWDEHFRNWDVPAFLRIIVFKLTFLLQASYILTTKKYIPSTKNHIITMKNYILTTRKVHPNYEEGG